MTVSRNVILTAGNEDSSGVPRYDRGDSVIRPAIIDVGQNMASIDRARPLCASGGGQRQVRVGAWLSIVGGCKLRGVRFEAIACLRLRVAAISDPFSAMSDATLSAELMDALQREAFDYFVHEANPLNGLLADKAQAGWPASIAAVGFAVSSCPVGVEHGFMTRASATQRTLATLRFFHNRTRTRSDRVRIFRPIEAALILRRIPGRNRL